MRSVVDVYTYPTASYLATYEVASANLEGLVFENVSGIAEANPVSPGTWDLQSGRLNGTDPARRIGTSLLVKVMAGDKVSMNVNNFYQGYNPAADNPVPMATMLSGIVSTLVGGSGGFEGSEEGNTTLVSKLFTTANYQQLDNIVNSSSNPNRPKAYLNYVLFDEDMRIVGTMAGAFQANGNGSGNWTTIGTEEGDDLVMPANGYLAVYLSNKTASTCIPCADVYFDLLTVRFTRGNLLEETHYYPHGLPIYGLSGRTATGFQDNRRKYQSKEYIKDLGLNWMDFDARQYDPQIGRFLSVDPLADDGGQQVYSSYAAMGNAPESMVDPDGMQFSASANLPDYFSILYRGTFPTAGLYLPGGALSGKRENAFDRKSWGGMSGSALQNYISAQNNNIASMIMGDVFESGIFAGNIGTSSGGAINGGSLPEVNVKEKGFFGKLWGGIKNGTSKAWKWAKGIKFHFNLGGEISFGSQLGAEVKILGKNSGFDVNLGSAQYLQGQIDIGTDGGSVSGNYYGRDNTIVMKHGLEGGLGYISGGIENEYKLNSEYPDQFVKATISGGEGPLGASIEHTIPIGPQSAPQQNASGLHLDAVGKLKVLIGVEIKISIGFTHD